MDMSRPSSEDDVKTEKSQTCYKITRTVWLITVWISMGSFMEVTGATLKDLVYRLGTDYGSISSSYSGRSVGKLVGTVLAGILVDRYGMYADLMIAVALSVAALFTVFVPWVKYVELLWFFYFVLGICLGAINIPGQRILLCTWLDKSASPMHIIHLGYGAGGFLVPLIVNPFLADFGVWTEMQNITNKTNVQEQTGNVSTLLSVNISTMNSVVISTNYPDTNYTANVSTTTTKPISRIEYGYAIIAIYTVSIATVFYIYQYVVSKGKFKASSTGNELKGSKKLLKKRKLKEMINPASCADGNLCFGSLILGLMFFRYFWIAAVDRTCGTFLRTYAVDQLQFSTYDASYINTVYWIGYSFGRLVTFVLARWVSIRIIMVAETVATVLTGIFLLIFALDSQIAMWILAACMGSFLGPMFPSGIAWGDFHIEMTGMAITFVILGSAFGGYIFIKVSGSAFDEYGPVAFVYLYLGIGGCILVIDLFLTCVSLMKSRLVKQREPAKADEKETIEIKPF